MKIIFLKIFIPLFSLIIILLLLLYKGKIWFVYPDRNIFSVEGLDVSHHQGEINWENVDGKYQFVFVKATEGDTYIDKYFCENAKNIKKTQRILGAYHFFHFNYGGIEQANNFINTVGNLIDLPPVIDLEFSGNPLIYYEPSVMRELIKCIETLENYYQNKVILYVTHDSYKHFIKNNFDNPIWYRSILLPLNKNIKNVLFWQYHDRAIIDGINVNVDLNVFKGNIKELEKYIMK